MLLRVHPLAFHRWHMAMYVDPFDWVSLPNTLGMSQFGDGGIVGSKSYCATGRYIRRMSDFCEGCGYNPTLDEGKTACPLQAFTGRSWIGTPPDSKATPGWHTS